METEAVDRHHQTIHCPMLRSWALPRPKGSEQAYTRALAGYPRCPICAHAETIAVCDMNVMCPKGHFATLSDSTSQATCYTMLPSIPWSPLSPRMGVMAPAIPVVSWWRL